VIVSSRLAWVDAVVQLALLCRVWWLRAEKLLPNLTVFLLSHFFISE
jgi:hypothetical protein